MRNPRHSFFPLVVAALTVLLAGLVYGSVQTPSPTPGSAQPVVELVDAQAYRDSLIHIVRTFDERLTLAQDDQGKRLAAQTALSNLLALRVPAQFQDLHLALAVALSTMENALASGDQTIDEALAQIAGLEETYPWLAP